MDRPRYLRAPSPALHTHLGPQGLLAPLLRPRTLGRLRLDVHLREGNRVHAYYAQARVINAHLAPDRVHLDADPAYHVAQGTTPLFSAWHPSDVTLQLLQYAHEWRTSFAQVRADVEAVREARVALGLSPAHTPCLNGEFRLVLGFGEDLPSKEVLSRVEQVRSIANRYLPAGAAPIEMWAMKGGEPVRLP